jgi:zinc protease
MRRSGFLLTPIALLGMQSLVHAQSLPGAVSTPPPPSAPRVPLFPAPVERTLANGLRVIAVQQLPGGAPIPLVSAQIAFSAGGAAEKLPGVATLTASLLTSGTATHDALAIAQMVDALGARLDAAAGYDASMASVGATTPKFAEAFALFADVLLHPSFAIEELSRAKVRTLNELRVGYSSPTNLARLVAARVAYGDAPYGRPLQGTPDSVGAIHRDDVVAFHAAAYRPDTATLVIGGDIMPADAFALADRVFGAWRAPATPKLTAPVSAPLPARSHVVVIDKPDAGRTAIVAGRAAIARGSADYYAGSVTTAVLSGYSGRLNQEVRVKRGLSYGAGASLVARRDAGVFLATTLVDFAKTAEGTKVVLDTLASITRATLSNDELMPRKATITGGYYRGIETIDGLVGTLGEFALYGVPLAELSAYPARIQAVDDAQIHRFVERYVADKPFVVLVGDAKVFLDAVRAVVPDVTVIAAADLDVGSAKLTK